MRGSFDLVIQKLLWDAARILFVCKKYSCILSEHAQYRLLNFLKHLKAQGTVESQTLYLYHVFLDTECTAAAKDTEQLIIRYKEKSWESISLRIQIIIQAFLAFLQHIVYMMEVWQTIWGFTAFFYCRVFYSFIHYLCREKRKFRKCWTAIGYIKLYLINDKACEQHKQIRFL